jgi:hypothetical protein
MEFPAKWECFEAEQFSSAQPRSAGELGMELLVQVRPNGRMLDHFRIALGGSRVLDVNAAMADLLQIPSAKHWRLRMLICPRDIEVKRNMISSAWMDVKTLVAAKAAQMVVAGDDGEEAGLAHATVVGEMDEAEVGAAIRFAVIIGGDQRLYLALQGLPATADYLMGRPAFRG